MEKTARVEVTRNIPDCGMTLAVMNIAHSGGDHLLVTGSDSFIITDGGRLIAKVIAAGVYINSRQQQAIARLGMMLIEPDPEGIINVE